MCAKDRILYIIGNGFDRHHNLPTSYDNFRDDYVKKHPVIRRELYELYGNRVHEDLWWSHFENMLGEVDYINLLNSKNGAALGPAKVQQLLRNTLPPLFGEWIKNVNEQIDKVSIYRIPNLELNALFFTFNYTTILESVYGVSPSNIWYIHHSVNEYITQGINPIVGHDSEYMRLSNYSDRAAKDIPDYLLDNINNEILNAAKKVNNRIILIADKLKEKYADINHIIAMGFSFNDIDMPYIEKIVEVNENGRNIKWSIYWHSNGEDIMIKQKLLKLGASEDKINLIEW